MLNPWGAQAEAHDRKTVLRHGGALSKGIETGTTSKFRTFTMLPFLPGFVSTHSTLNEII